MTNINLQDIYKKEVVPALLGKYKNVHKIPKIEKVVINLGIKKIVNENSNALTILLKDLRNICCQEPCIIKAKKSRDSFSIKKGDVNAIKLTLRNHRMYNFLNKLIFFALPRTRDFQGFNKDSFDGKGNISFGIADCGAFYEVDKKNAKFLYGMNITLTTTALDKAAALEMLKMLYFTFNDRI